MQFSKYNIFSKLKDSENYYIVNLLTGNADIINPEEAKKIIDGKIDDEKMYIDKGYLVDEQEEKKRYNSAYLDFIDTRDDGEIQLFFVPTYACNFNCSYCYQSGYSDHVSVVEKKIVDAFFNYVDTEFAGKKVYITIFGGEPLLPGKNVKDNMIYMLTEAKKRNLGVALVTNGYELSNYIDILKMGIIKEIQVTIDGTADIHNLRRPLHSGANTFDRIVEGVDKALEAKFPINLRMVVDKENIQTLPEFSQFAIDKGWTKSFLFKTQLGRNYELHYCQSSESKLYTRIELYEKLYNMVQEYPHILEFYRPAFSISRYLADTGALPDALFDSCPGTKTEWAFDYSGNIYSCTATVGKKGEELGTFYPEVSKNEDIITQWEERDVTTIPECKDCNVQLACGGGCASVAKNNNGKVQSPDCRPIKKLMEMGLSLYFNRGE